MTSLLFAVRLMVAALLVGLGLVIIGRGLAEGAPLTFTAMGLLMAALGVYRLRLLRAIMSRSH